jgi:hypothetical protein
MCLVDRPGTLGGFKMIVECCKCGKIRVEDEWFPADTETRASAASVSHTYCPPCLDIEIDQFTRQQEHQNAYGFGK